MERSRVRSRTIKRGDYGTYALEALKLIEGKERITTFLLQRLRCVALRPSAGTSIAVGDSNGGLRVYDTRSRRKIFESTIDSYVYSHRDAITDVQWHPAGDFLAATSMDGSTKIWDFRDQRCAWTLKAHEGSVNCAAFTADGSTFACGGSDGIVTLWKSGFNRSFENVVLSRKNKHTTKNTK